MSKFIPGPDYDWQRNSHNLRHVETNNSEVLDDFVEYCERHPGLRFWQALRSWSGADFILETNFAPHDFGKADGWMKDTFYREGKDK